MKCFISDTDASTIPSYIPSLPQQDSGSDDSITYATLSEGNITIGGEKTSAAALGINSNTANATSTVDDIPDLEALIAKQQAVTQAPQAIAEGAKNYADIMVSHAKETGDTASQAKWETGGSYRRALTAVSTAISGALGGQTTSQVLTNTTAPYAAALIGSTVGHGDNKNQAADLMAHAILGAVIASVNKQSAAAGAVGGATAETAANYFVSQLNPENYLQALNADGTINANKLPQDVKESIASLSAAVGAVAGGISGDSVASAQLAGVIGKNAVENNSFGMIERYTNSYPNAKGLSDKEINKVDAENKRKEDSIFTCDVRASSACRLGVAATDVFKDTAKFVLTLPTEAVDIIFPVDATTDLMMAGIGAPTSQKQIAKDIGSIGISTIGGITLKTATTSYKTLKSVIVYSGIGGTVNATTQLALNGGNIYAINWKDVGTAALTSGATYGKGTLFTIGLGTASGASENAVNGDNPVTGGILGFLGSGFGYGTEKLVGKFNFSSETFTKLITNTLSDTGSEVIEQGGTIMTKKKK